HIWIEASGLIDRAGGRLQRRLSIAGWRQRGALLDRKERKEPVCHRERFARVKRRIGIGAYAKIIDQIVVDSEAGPHGPGSPAGWIPSQTDADRKSTRLNSSHVA